MTSIKLLILTATITLIGWSAQAKDSEESLFLLKAAIAESNGDYNKNLEKSYLEEADRAHDWSSRDEGAIYIEGENLDAATQDEFQEISQGYQVGGREVSSLYETDDNDDILND